MNAQTETEKGEWLTCAESFLYFCGNYCQIYDAVSGKWVPFVLWKGHQVGVARTLFNNLLIVILKARQLGMTWLVLAFALWLMLFRPAATILLFSKRDDEAVELLDFRIKGMYHRLPAFLKCQAVLTSNDHEWELSNGSRALSFPTTGGRSYTATMVIVDEADFIPDLNAVMTATQPTIDAGGRMVVLSSSNKQTPISTFKNLYRAAKDGAPGWVSVFLAWSVAPWRTAEWYSQKVAEILRTTTSKDDLFKEYPATDAEALAPASSDKRIPYEWLEQCYDASVQALSADNLPKDAPSMGGLHIYRLPQAGRKYVLGADPAEGNPTSDDSSLDVVDRESGEQVATLAGKFQPEIFAAHIDTVGTFFDKADVLCERNNHGHAVIMWLREHSKLKILKASDDKDGWNTTALSKSLLYDNATTMLRERETLIHNFETVTQLALIEGATLSAPKEMHDDRATSFVLALMARLIKAPEPRIR